MWWVGVSVDDVSVELRFFCRRFQQLGLLYRLLAAKSPAGASGASSASGTPSSTAGASSAPPSLEDVVSVGVGNED